jgi:hypothetical protein
MVSRGCRRLRRITVHRGSYELGRTVDKKVRGLPAQPSLCGPPDPM